PRGGEGGVEGVFLAAVDGKKYAPGLIAVDPLGIGNLAAGFGFVGGEEVAFLSLDEANGGFWYLSSTKAGAVNGRGKPLLPIVDALRYDIDTTIASNLLISGSTTIQARSHVEGTRVVPIHILPKLRLKEATVTVGGKTEPAEIIQEDDELGKFARLFKEEVADSNAAVVAPSPLPADAEVVIGLRYEGKDVLESAGMDSYSVRARESWYPNVGTFTDLATYTLTYHFPKGNMVVSTGKMVKQESGDKQLMSRWESEQPIRVAGFNYGRFEKISEKDAPSGLQLDIYTNREQRKFAHDTLVDAQNAARTATAFFGPAPSSSVSVTQQAESFFGQSWPSLVFLPSLALTNSAERVQMLEQLGPRAIASINEFAKTVGWHEMAHQWWGHLVGWESYRDQWLSEGFAEFTSALVLQFTENGKKYDDFWERKRETILEKGRGSVANSDSGPITDGFRVATKNSPSAGQAIIYDKGSYVLHMLRMMLHDPGQKNADGKFIIMMRDFISSYAGRNPSTLDFQHVVERHMTPQMNAAGNGTMDYFFRQWVDGTSIPKFKSDLRVEPGNGGKYRITGSLAQEGVPEDFISVVPLYVEFPKGQIAKIGAIRLIGSRSQSIQTELALPEKPIRVTANAFHDLLSR
ncbi:MAG TPA: M1 family aminopeptidase, partial [Thermoanaerobaculia bacterium]|nr:M1 family aminopeptidase [Thermoanaerobaculia bacterium]